MSYFGDWPYLVTFVLPDSSITEAGPFATKKEAELAADLVRVQNATNVQVEDRARAQDAAPEHVRVHGSSRFFYGPAVARETAAYKKALEAFEATLTKELGDVPASRDMLLSLAETGHVHAGAIGVTPDGPWIPFRVSLEFGVVNDDVGAASMRAEIAARELSQKLQDELTERRKGTGT